MRVLRDLLNPSTEVIHTNSQEYSNIITRYMKEFFPFDGPEIVIHPEETMIFEKFNINSQIEKALKRKVILKSGGNITIDETEGLITIDVNSGKFTGNTDHEITVTKTNIEAALEIARQLRLRNLGGIIIIDFIDMKKASNRKTVYETLLKALEYDTATSNIQRISRLGLVEMTRERERYNLSHTLQTECPVCNGSGRIKSYSTVIYDILRDLIYKMKNSKRKMFLVEAHPDIIKTLFDKEKEALYRIQNKYNRVVTFMVSQSHEQGNYRVKEL